MISGRNMATLANVLPNGTSTAIIVPAQGSDQSITLSFEQLQGRCVAFQQRLASLGIGNYSAVSIALPNSLEFIVSTQYLSLKLVCGSLISLRKVSFLAVSWQRAWVDHSGMFYSADLEKIG